MAKAQGAGGAWLTVLTLLVHVGCTDVREQTVPAPDDEAAIERIAEQLEPRERSYFLGYMERMPKMRRLTSLNRPDMSMKLRTVSVAEAVEFARTLGWKKEEAAAVCADGSC